MVNNKKKTIEVPEAPLRRRGRPTGKNRIPLSQEERRARNALYERERRNETAEAMTQLIEAVNCDPHISNADLLATVISRIQRAARNKSEDISHLERINENLEAQIATLQDRLGLDDEALERLDGSDDDDSKLIDTHSNMKKSKSIKILDKNTKKRKRSERLSSESFQQNKRAKTRSETLSVDSGIELRGHTVSPPAICAQDQDSIQVQYLSNSEQLPVEISEEQDGDASPAYIELQTELYNQIYNSESQSSVESTPGSQVASSDTQTKSILSRSLIVIPSIVPPQQESPTKHTHTQSDVTCLQNVELPCDFNNEKECNFQHDDDQEPNFDFLTDTEKELLSNWISAELLELNEDTQNQVRSLAINDMLSGYS